MSIYSAYFNYAVERTLGIEGGYVDDGVDRGGPTNLGITQAEALRHGIADVRAITRDQAIQIYYQDYWLVCNLDEIGSRSVTAELFDTAVNCGIVITGKNLQEAFNVLFSPPEPALKIDGKIGPKTITATNFQLPRYEMALWKACNGEQYIHYKNLKISNPGYASRYIRGWSANRL